MADSSVSKIDPVRAAMSAGAVSWRVFPGSQTINLASWASGKLEGLSGDWAAEDFLQQFDGLHRRELMDCLFAPERHADIDIAVMLSTGETAHFRGRADDARGAEGLVFLEERQIAPEENIKVEAVFQPIVNLADRRVAGFECLARLRRQDGHLMSVDAGHPVLGIGPVMAREALDLLGRAGREDWFVNLNISARELGDPSAVRDIASIVSAGKLRRKQVRVELTEQAALRDRIAARAGLAVLREAGAGIVLDDFGAGHSSMTWLSDLEIDGVKLDAGLLQNLHTPKGRLIVERLISLLRELELEVVIEGVEDAAVVPELLDIGASLAQGFALGQPVPLTDIDALNGSG